MTHSARGGFGIGPGHKLVDPGCRPEIDQLGYVRVHAIEFTSFNERGDDCPVGPTFIATSKQRMFAIEDNFRWVCGLSGN
jgi:hypothetical protein